LGGSGVAKALQQLMPILKRNTDKARLLYQSEWRKPSAAQHKGDLICVVQRWRIAHTIQVEAVRIQKPRTPSSLGRIHHHNKWVFGST